MTDLVALKAANAKRWVNARLIRDFMLVARHLASPTAKSQIPGCLRQNWPALAPKSSPSDPALPPSITHPSSGSIGAFLVAMLTAIFRRK